jgi:adenine deaminase
MRPRDTGVDLRRQAEVVGVNDQALQTAAPRLSKNTGSILLVSNGSLKRPCETPK